MASADPRSLLLRTAERAARYLDALPNRRVAPWPEALAGMRGLDTALPAGPYDPEETIARLDELGGPATVATAGGRYFGFVTGGAMPATVAAGWLAAAWDQNASFVPMSPVGALLEEVSLLRWTDELAPSTPSSASRAKRPDDDHLGGGAPPPGHPNTTLSLVTVPLFSFVHALP